MVDLEILIIDFRGVGLMVILRFGGIRLWFLVVFWGNEGNDLCLIFCCVRGFDEIMFLKDIYFLREGGF